ncbi:MAG: putative DNA binding domain-containing protein [Peptoniphilus harei]|nr:putative DNA binding domain-containing protein [Peptoniphilus harei]
MRETRNLEFKEKISDSFLKTAVAFANYDGGEVLFGVDDNGKSVGLTNLKSDAIAIENKINDSITPKIDFEIEVDCKKKIIKLTISPGIEKPYFYKSKSYKRNDSSTVEIDSLELKRLIMEGQNKSYDSLSSKKENNSFVYLEKKFKEIVGIEKINNDILKTLELVDKNNFLTNAGSLFADNNEDNLIDIVRFGESRNTILSRLQLKNISILEAFDISIDKYREYYQFENIKGSYREKVDLIPEKAFREAIANALVHRDWMANSYIQVSMEKEFITIVSPGGLPTGISEEEYLNGQISVMRNPIIGNIFFRLNIIESFGTGIKRIKEAYKDSAKNPTFKIFDNSIEVRLPVISKVEALNSDEQMVYKALEYKSLASSVIANDTGFGKNKVLNLLNDLMDKGYVIKRGKGRGTKYSLK